MLELQERFIEKITREYEEFRTGLYQLTYDEIIDKAQRIADMKYYYDAFKDGGVTPTPQQFAHFLEMDKPLESIADSLSSVDLCGLNDDIEYHLWDMVESREDESTPAFATEEVAGVEP